MPMLHIQNEIKLDWLRKEWELQLIPDKRDDGSTKIIW